jgi:hypothetical protein
VLSDAFTNTTEVASTAVEDCSCSDPNMVLGSTGLCGCDFGYNFDVDAGGECAATRWKFSLARVAPNPPPPPSPPPLSPQPASPAEPTCTETTRFRPVPQWTSRRTR